MRADNTFGETNFNPNPPAEGAEEFLKGCEHDGSFIPVHEVIRLMNAFAASQKQPYPHGKMFKEQQPTAEGAEEKTTLASLKRDGIYGPGNDDYGRDKPLTKEDYEEIIKPMLEAQKANDIHPSAFEWHNHTTGHCYVDYIPHAGAEEKDGYTVTPLFAALHAQRLADKMVEEMDETAIKALETIYHAFYSDGESPEEQVIDLKSIALKALEEINNLKSRDK